MFLTSVTCVIDLLTFAGLLHSRTNTKASTQ